MFRQKKTETMTFRLDKDLAEELKANAEIKQVSPNVLINQLLTNYKKFTSNASLAGFLLLPKSTLIRIMDKLTEKEVKQISKEHVENDMKDIIMMFRTKYDIDNFLDVLESWLKVSELNYRKVTIGSGKKYIIQHDMGKNWSIYFAEIFGNTIEHLSSKKVKKDVTSSSIVLEFTV